MTASELRQLWPVCQREDIRAGRKQRRRWKTWPEDINHNHQYNRYQLGISYIFEISEFSHHPKTSNVSGTPGNGAEGRKHGHYLENNVDVFTFHKKWQILWIMSTLLVVSLSCWTICTWRVSPGRVSIDKFYGIKFHSISFTWLVSFVFSVVYFLQEWQFQN